MTQVNTLTGFARMITRIVSGNGAEWIGNNPDFATSGEGPPMSLIRPALDGGELQRIFASAAAREVFDAVTRPEMKPRTKFEEVPGAGSCVHLDRSSAFLEGVNAFIGDKDDIL